MKQVVRYGAYPFVLALGIALHYLLLENKFGVYFATYLPVIVGAVMVTGLEWKYPYRLQWLADKQEIVQDAIFMVLIQGVLPKLLAVTVAFTFSQVLQMHHLIVEGWWPAHWPVPLQMLLRMVLADGLRY